MKIDRKYWAAYFILTLVVGTVFSLGIFNNPNFNIHDFCMGLSTEILGIIIVIVVIDRYTNLKLERRKAHKKETEHQK